jgi:hypothetical protein
VLSYFPFLLFFHWTSVFLLSAQLISTESRAKVKWAGDDGHQSQESTRDGEALEGSAVVLSFFLSSFSLLSAKLISTESHGRTSNGRATTESTEQRQEECLMNCSVLFFVNFFKGRG